MIFYENIKYLYGMKERFNFRSERFNNIQNFYIGCTIAKIQNQQFAAV